MSLNRWNPKRDANEKAITDALRAIGVIVHRLSSPGVGDLIAYHWREGVLLLEVKAPKGTLTLAQQQSRIPRCIVRTVAEALALYGVQA